VVVRFVVPRVIFRALRDAAREVGVCGAVQPARVEGFGVGADVPGVRGEGGGGEDGGEAVGGGEEFGFLEDGAGDEVVEGHLVEALADFGGESVGVAGGGEGLVAFD